jgi:rhamnosyltransferase
MVDSDSLAAVLTAYRPDDALATRFGPLLKLCRWIIVVDNTPGAHPFPNIPEGFIVLQDGINKGLGPALNQGLREAMRRGAHQAILFDQDSTPSPEFVAQMLAELSHAQASRGRRCCVGPMHVDDGALKNEGSSPHTDRIDRPGEQFQTVTCLPTSGMTLSLDAFGPDDFFSAEFFLDLVDFEWCWRLRRRGWVFLRAANVSMFHRLGEQERRILGFTFHVPAPYRHYFQVRDSLNLAFKDYVPTYSKLRLIGILPVKALVYPFLLDRGLERLSWMVRGVRDSLKGVRGVGAAATRLSR